MGSGYIVGDIDVAQLVLYAFWIFFFGLILYLNRESRREGYPLHSEIDDLPLYDERHPKMMKPKYYRTKHGFEMASPNYQPDDNSNLQAVPVHPWPGAPLEPTTDNPMLSGVGPAAYAMFRRDEPELTWDGQPKLLPMRKLPDFNIADGSRDVRGFEVLGRDGETAGTVADVWIDQEEQLIRFLEVECANGGPKVMLPMTLARLRWMANEFIAESVTAAQFKDCPQLKNPDQITLLEEDKVSAYFASGELYNNPDWQA